MNTPILYILLSALPMFICFFWTLYYLCKYKDSRTDQKILFWFMLTATSLYTAHFIFFNRIYQLIPVSDMIYNFATLAVYPLYLIYIRSITEGFNKKQLLYLIPALILSLFIGALYALMPTDTLQEFINGYEYQLGEIHSHPLILLSKWAHNLVKLIFAIQIIPILYFGLKKLDHFKKKVEEYFSGNENEQMNAIRALLIFFVITSFMSAMANLIGRTFFTGAEWLIAIPSILFSTLLFAVGYAGSMLQFTIANVLQESHEETPAKEQTENKERIQDNEIAQENDTNRLQKADIDKVMEEEQLYLNPELKLSDLATRLNTNRTYVYNALKASQDLSFNDYVNEYRIRHTLETIHTAQKKDLCIEDLICTSGFQSKTSFYRNFKKITGTTPMEYIQKNLMG